MEQRIQGYLEGFVLVERQVGAVFLVNGKVVGFALAHEGRIVHICLFPNAGNRKADSPTRMARDSTRRERRGV
jgi:hypothetical protein